MAFKLNDQQHDAVMKCLNWYYLESHKKNMFIVCGLAGSGKSTCLRSMIEALGLGKNSVLYCAITGKASLVMKMKGHLANTIHRSFYNAKPYKNSVFFTLKQSIPSNVKLIVIDEFGMVEDNMTREILSFGIPVIVLCDNKQLPPVFGKNTYIDEDEKLDVFLTKVMRTNDTTGILQLADLARNKKDLPVGTIGLSRVLDDKNKLKSMLDYSKVICWTNRTRRFLNDYIRKEIGITSRYPLKGERIMFLGNRYDHTIDYIGIEICITNGMECIVMEDYHIENDKQIRLKVRPIFIDDEDIFFDVLCNRRVFDSYVEDTPDIKTLMITDKEEELGSVFCDFCYAVSAHQAQGSSWYDILVIDEMPKHRPEYSRWLYTAITRSENSVDVLLDQ